LDIVDTGTLKRRRRNIWLSAYHLLTFLLVWASVAADGFGRGPCDVPFGYLLLFLVSLAAVALCFAGIRLSIRNSVDKYFLFINLAILAVWFAVWFLV